MARSPTLERPNRIKNVLFSDLYYTKKEGRTSRRLHRIAFTKCELAILRARDLTLTLSQEEKDLLTDIADQIHAIGQSWENPIDA